MVELEYKTFLSYFIASIPKVTITFLKKKNRFSKCNFFAKCNLNFQFDMFDNARM